MNPLFVVWVAWVAGLPLHRGGAPLRGRRLYRAADRYLQQRRLCRVRPTAGRQPPLRPSSRVKLTRRPRAIHLLMYCRHQLCSPYASTSRAAVGQRWLCRHADACKRSMLLFARHHLVPLLPPQLPQQRHRHRRGCCCCPAAPWVCRPGRLLRRLCSGPPRRL